MSTANIKEERLLCFIDGEPYLFNTIKRKFFKLNLDYNTYLELIKKEVSTLDKRPRMSIIWKILATKINCCTRYCYNINQHTQDMNADCFENRLTRDITKYLDTIFSRGISDEEKERLKKYRENYSPYYYSSSNNYVRQIYRAKLNARKLGQKVY